MAIHPDFPTSPYTILDPDIRWFPADEALRESSYEKLLPPLVHELRRKVKEWREGGYAGASDTSVNLLNWWFNYEHLLPKADGTTAPFQYYFAQREACLYAESESSLQGMSFPWQRRARNIARLHSPVAILITNRRHSSSNIPAETAPEESYRNNARSSSFWYWTISSNVTLPLLMVSSSGPKRCSSPKCCFFNESTTASLLRFDTNVFSVCLSIFSLNLLGDK